MKKFFLIITALVLSFNIAGADEMSQDLVKRIDEVFGAVYNNPNEPGAAVLIMQGCDTL